MSGPPFSSYPGPPPQQQRPGQPPQGYAPYPPPGYGPPGGMPMAPPPNYQGVPPQPGAYNPFYQAPPMYRPPPPLGAAPVQSSTYTAPPIMSRGPVAPSDAGKSIENQLGRQPSKVYVGKIPPDTPDELIRAMLQACGKVSDWSRKIGTDGKPKSFGYCEFAHYEGTIRAIRILNGYKLASGELIVKTDTKTQEELNKYDIAVKKEVLPKLGYNLEGKTDEEILHMENPNRKGADEEARRIVKMVVERELGPLGPSLVDDDELTDIDPEKRGTVKSEIENFKERLARKEQEKRRKLLEEEAKERERRLKELERATKKENGEEKSEKDERRRHRDRERDSYEGRRSRRSRSRSPNRRRRSRSSERRYRDRNRDDDYDRHRKDRRRRRYESDESDDERRRRSRRSRSIDREREGRRGRRSRSSSPQPPLPDQAPPPPSEEVQPPLPGSEPTSVSSSGFKVGMNLKKTVALGGKKAASSPTTVFAATEEESVEEKAKKRKLIPIEYTEEELKAASRDMCPDGLIVTLADGAKFVITDDSDNEEARKMRLKSLADCLPTSKDKLFSFRIDWSVVERSDILEKRLKPWVGKKVAEYAGEEIVEFRDFIIEQIRKKTTPEALKTEVEAFLDDVAEEFVMKTWRMLLFEVERDRLRL